VKILQINTTVNSGSTGRIAEDIGRTLLSNGHQSYIAFGRGNQNSYSQKIKIGSGIDVNFHAIKTLITDRHGFGSKKATEQLIKEIELVNPDVIGLHNIHGYYLNIVILFNYIKEKKIPVVWTFHDCWPFTGHCTYFDSVQCEKWKTHCHSCPKTSKYPKSIGFDASFKNFKDKKRIFNQVNNVHIVTPSKWLKELVEQSFLNHPVSCIHNGIDLSQFKFSSNGKSLKKRMKLNSRKIILGVANTWDERKGLLEFINLSKVLDETFQIILIGLSKNQIKNLPPNILGFKRTKNLDELVEYYSASDIFINPTFQDNFPTTNLEALACGTPVVTYNTGGSVEAIDNETGIIVEKSDVMSLKDAIYNILNSDDKFTREKCRKRAVKLFDKNDRYYDYLQLYEQVSKLNKA
jgi:glycosyltransferase involved in cell wall biosynthesis